MSRDLVERWVHPAVRRLTAYCVPPADGLIKLDAMENPYPWPEGLVDAWLERLRGARLNRYPDPEACELKAALRAYVGPPAGTELLLGNGSDELILMIALALQGPERVILAPEPSFVMYRLVAEVVGFRYVGVPLRRGDFGLNVAAMRAAIAAHQPAVVFLACPNNPTGNLFDRNEVEAVLEAAPGVVVIDEAYRPFAGESWVGETTARRNLLVLQTLSKVGLAGLRVGMLIGAPAWLAEINKVRLPYNLNVLSQLSAAFILEHAELLRAQARQICLGRERLYAELEAMEGVEVWPSRANFLLLRVRPPAPRVHAALRAAGVLVKCLDGAHPLLENCLRVSVGTEQENRCFLDALRAALAAA